MVRHIGILPRLIKALCLWLVLPAALLLALRLAWQARADQRFATTVASLKASHLRITPEDFPDDATIPPTENASLILFTGPISWTTAESRLVDKTFAGQTPAEYPDVLKIFDAHPDLLPRIDAAAAAPQTLWPRAIFTDPTWLSSHSAAGWTGAARLLVNAACIAHAQHDDQLALEHIRRILAIAHIFEKSPVVIHNLLALNFRGAAAPAIWTLAPDLDLKSSALQEQAQQLAADLATDNDALNIFARCWQGQLTTQLPFYCDPAYERDVPWPLRPLYRDTFTRRLQLDVQVIDAYRAGNFPEFQRRFARIPKIDRSAGNLEVILHLHEGIFSVTSLETFFARAANQLAATRAASLLLAARIYGARHGNLPPSADFLVPDILPAIPIDPNTDPPRPLSYRLSTPTYPFVWSVGPDNHDDNGTTKDLLFPAPPTPLPALFTTPPPPSSAAARRTIR